MTEPQNLDNLEPIYPPVDPHDIVTGIRHSLSASNPWAWGNTTLEFASSTDDAAPGQDSDVGPEPDF